jgi:hypothetical protein
VELEEKDEKRNLSRKGGENHTEKYGCFSFEESSTQIKEE